MAMRPLHLELEIDYQDSDGGFSTRRITVKQFELEDDGRLARLAAHCSSSGSFGDFSSDRIRRCLDLASGAPVSDLPALLAERFAQSRQGRLEALERHLGNELVVLLTVGHADRLLQSREQEMIAAFLQPRQRIQHGAEPLAIAEIASHLRWLPLPSAERFEAAVEVLAAAASDERQALFATCLAVADVREAREGGEQPALDRLQARWFGGG